MPKDFANALIYKLVSNNLEVLDCYVGSTTSFNKRKQKHKEDCTKSTHKQYNYPVYKFIREHGGWDDWTMVLVEKYPCNDKHELHARERYYIEHLKSSLNRTIPTRTPREHREANKEKIAKQRKTYRDQHKDLIRDRDKEYRENNEEKIKARKSELVRCEDCDISVTRDNQSQHRQTIQHRKKAGLEVEALICADCGKSYTKQNVLRHKQSAFHLKVINKPIIEEADE